LVFFLSSSWIKYDSIGHWFQWQTTIPTTCTNHPCILQRIYISLILHILDMTFEACMLSCVNKYYICLECKVNVNFYIYYIYVSIIYQISYISFINNRIKFSSIIYEKIINYIIYYVEIRWATSTMLITHLIFHLLFCIVFFFNECVK